MHRDPEIQLMLDVWLKAYQDGEVRIPLDSKADLTNIRFKLYNAARKVKAQPPGTDFKLEDAVNNCSIRTEAETTLVVYRKDKSNLLAKVAFAIGGKVKVAEDTASLEDEANAALARMGLAPATAKPEPQTPFDKVAETYHQEIADRNTPKWDALEPPRRSMPEYPTRANGGRDD